MMGAKTITTQVFGFLQLMVALQCATFTVFLLARARGKGIANKSLGMMLGLLSAHMVILAWQQSGLLGEGLKFVHLFGLLYGPLFYFYVVGLVYEKPAISPRTSLHLAPFVLSALLFASMHLPQALVATSTFVSIGSYLVASYAALRRHQEVLNRTRSDSQSVSLRWLQLFIFGLALILFFDVASFLSNFVTAWANGRIVSLVLFCVLLLYINLFVLAALEHPPLFQGITAEDQMVAAAISPAAPKSEPSVEEAEDATRIQQLMTSQKMYLETSLTISQVALQVGLPARRVSQVINRCFQRNFSDFVNSLRIEEAKSLLLEDGGKKNVLEISLEAGFNSKSSFNTIFKEKTGMSPSQYRSRFQR